MDEWQKHYIETGNKPPSKLLLEALPYIENKTKALDLGSGALVESKYLLAAGFEVIAVDQEKSPEQILDDKFKFIQSAFKDYDFPPETFDLITAQFSLPFNGKNNFTALLDKIRVSLKPRGIFVGQLFGVNDEWNTIGTELAFHSKLEVEELLTGLEILKLEEGETDGKLSNGDPKHWHIFDIIARRIK